jgi:hypothetical protein
LKNVLKEWEMETSHLNFSDWESVDLKEYRINAKGGEVYEGENATQMGSYNVLLACADKSLSDSEKESFHPSRKLFRGAFEGAFPWEVADVFSKPPKTAFS